MNFTVSVIYSVRTKYLIFSETCLNSGAGTIQNEKEKLAIPNSNFAGFQDLGHALSSGGQRSPIVRPWLAAKAASSHPPSTNPCVVAPSGLPRWGGV